MPAKMSPRARACVCVSCTLGHSSCIKKPFSLHYQLGIVSRKPGRREWPRLWVRTVVLVLFPFSNVSLQTAVVSFAAKSEKTHGPL